MPAAREAALLLRIYRRLLAPFGAAPLLPLVEARHDTLLRVAELAGGGIAARDCFGTLHGVAFARTGGRLPASTEKGQH